MAGETRQKILEAAENLIKIKGMARVTTKEIARETGLSEGALYRHFEHKEDVFFALIVQHLPTFLATFEAHMPGTGKLEDNLRTILLAVIEYFGKLIPMSASFLGDAELLTGYRKHMQQVASQPINGGPERLEFLLSAYLDEEKELGRLSSAVPSRTLSLSLLGPCFYYTYLQQLTDMQPFGMTREALIDDLLRELLPD